MILRCCIIKSWNVDFNVYHSLILRLTLACWKFIQAKAFAYQRVILNLSHSAKFKTDTGIELEDFRKHTGSYLKKLYDVYRCVS